jgi:hypothetical protein
MTLSFQAALNGYAWLRRKVSVAFCLQLAACAVVGWSVWHGGVAIAPPPAPGSGGTPATAPATLPASGTQKAPAPSPTASAQLAGTNPLAGAQLALSTIDVIVTRNDTLDRIFRRLKLNLADLATLRSRPALRAGLDTLRPG